MSSHMYLAFICMGQVEWQDFSWLSQGTCDSAFVITIFDNNGKTHSSEETLNTQLQGEQLVFNCDSLFLKCTNHGMLKLTLTLLSALIHFFKTSVQSSHLGIFGFVRN